MSPREPVVLIPGHMTDERIWKHQVDALAEFCDVIVARLDNRSLLPDIARSVLASAPTRFSLVGFSFGGYVAFEIMRQASKRVARLALIGTSARPDTKDQNEIRKANIERARAGELDEIIDAFIQRLGGPIIAKDHDLEQEIQAMVQSIPEAVYVSQQIAMLHRPDSRPHLPSISCPTAIICGTEDVLLPIALSAEIAAGIPNSAYIPIRDAGHMCMMEQPAAVSAVLCYWLQR
ncbi:alpha/beta fold hydrolase [Rhodoligotrophos defluvii]|uniref:alpha/beta fold hydrolase n=1 Tax=Rhodoligotrophos defluvii TaxID=2561934 RepID=UPI001484CB04|nr:alpha/beta fold hydrolase [Rhodoligotrophos defluvii]